MGKMDGWLGGVLISPSEFDHVAERHSVVLTAHKAFDVWVQDRVLCGGEPERIFDEGEWV